MVNHSKINKPIPPPGMHTDYDIIHSIGMGGIIDDKMSFNVLRATIESNLHESNKTVEETIKFFDTNNTKNFSNTFVAFKEAIVCYPVTAQNWHSGERIPTAHAEETSTMALTHAFQGHYKSAFQSIREIIELVILQLYFYKKTDKRLIGQWGRGEIRTPSLRDMLKEIRKDDLLKLADTKLGISNKILQSYDDLGAYIHTRGIQTTTMGLTGSNLICFSEVALNKFIKISTIVYRRCITIISTFFPTSIIAVKAFDKTGYFDPVWIPRENSVNCIRAVFTKSELLALEKIATKNIRYQTLVNKVNSLKSLSKEEIDSTYNHFMELSKNIEEYVKHIKVINSQFE